MWVNPEMRHSVGVGVWVEAHAPARLDLAGGWTDTPPICYEQGGAVLNIAIKVSAPYMLPSKLGCKNLVYFLFLYE